MGKTKSDLLLQMITGVIIIQVFAVVPVLGVFITGIATLCGLGGIVMHFGKRKTAK